MMNKNQPKLGKTVIYLSSLKNEVGYKRELLQEGDIASDEVQSVTDQATEPEEKPSEVIIISQQYMGLFKIYVQKKIPKIGGIFKIRIVV